MSCLHIGADITSVTLSQIAVCHQLLHHRDGFRESRQRLRAFHTGAYNHYRVAKQGAGVEMQIFKKRLRIK